MGVLMELEQIRQLFMAFAAGSRALVMLGPKGIPGDSPPQLRQEFRQYLVKMYDVDIYDAVRLTDYDKWYSEALSYLEQ
jgi:hypothetical protein